MRRIISALLIILTLLPLLLGTVLATDDGTEVSYRGSVLISDEKDSLTVSFFLPEESEGTYYLFKVLPINEKISSLSPVAEAKANGTAVTFLLDFDKEDHREFLYGYVLASKTSYGYTPLTRAHYIDNPEAVAHSSKPLPSSNTIKGLEVQYITDAQLLGVGHTVVHAKLNELISEDADNSTAFVYGKSKYYIDNSALTLLDYRIKTLTEAGINIYIDFILTFDRTAPEYLYYPNAEGDADAIFAPNVSNEESAATFAAVMHFLAERYGSNDGGYGFCGRYIIGYEVNDVMGSHNSGFTDFESNLASYASYLRLADLALKSAYSEARVYVSVSNLWNGKNDSADGVFGAKALLLGLSSLLPDIDFGIAINPYPISLTADKYWLEEKAEDAEDTEYLTMKNIAVLTDFLSSSEMLSEGDTRPVVISEFGISGVKGEDSEALQAASFALAYYTALKLPYIEAFIWHRHVDHNYEINLSYGLYSSTEFTLDGKDKKQIYGIFRDIDRKGGEKNVKSIFSHLPVSYEELLPPSYTPVREAIAVGKTSADIGGALWTSSTLYDFSKSLYSFYPSDNSSYLESRKENGLAFMRIATVKSSSIEYMGGGISLPDGISFNGNDYISVELRVISTKADAEFALLISGENNGKTLALKCSSSVKTNGWVTVNFPIDKVSDIELENAHLKLWIRSDASKDEGMLLDVASVKVYRARNITPLVVICIIIALALLSGGAVTVFVIYHRINARKRRGPRAPE